MTRGASGGVLALVALLAAMSGCASGSAEEAGAAASRGSAQTTATVRPPPTGPTAGDGFVAADAVSIADGVTLVPGADGRLPVRVRWVKETAAAEGLAVDGDKLLVLDEAAEALRLADGVEVWRSGDSVPGGMALVTSSGHLVVLDYA